MPTFEYRALTADGQRLKGEISARDEADAIDRLRSRDLFPIEARRAASGRMRLASPGSLHHQARVTAVIRELATLIDASQPVDQALRIVIETLDHRPVRTALSRMLDAVQSGQSLSEAMEGEPRLFAPIDVNLARAGEVAGRLGAALDELGTMRERQAQLARKVNSALIYPAILAITAIGAVLILLTVVIPEFQTLFEGRNDLLPPDTRAIFAVSGVLTGLGPGQMALALAVFLVLAQLRHVAFVRRGLERLAGSLPLLGRFLRVRNSAQLTRALAALRSGGVNLPTALELSSNALSSARGRFAIAGVVERVREGVPLADALQRADILDPMAVRLVRAGEESGELDAMLRKIASIFEDKLETGLLRIVAVLEPVLVLVMGLVAGGIVLSVMSAVISVNALTG
jgi:general secretion pathway protein F